MTSPPMAQANTFPGTAPGAETPAMPTRWYVCPREPLWGLLGHHRRRETRPARSRTTTGRHARGDQAHHQTTTAGPRPPVTSRCRSPPTTRAGGHLPRQEEEPQRRSPWTPVPTRWTRSARTGSPRASPKDCSGTIATARTEPARSPHDQAGTLRGDQARHQRHGEEDQDRR